MGRTSVHVGLILALTIRGLAIASYRDMRAVATAAEALGFDSIWLCDHFLTLAPAAYAAGARVNNNMGGLEGPPKPPVRSGRPGEAAAPLGVTRGFARSTDDEGGTGGSMPLLECWTTLAALSRDTTRVRLGTSVLCNSYRLPSVLAKMAATLDVISEGRVELGLGAGWFEREYAAYGIPFPKTSVRIAQLDEGLEVIRRMWTEPSASFRGEHYTIDGAVCDPPPVQRPHPPLWIGGEGDKVHRVAARAADGVNVRWWPPERVAARGPFLDAACRELGRDPATLRRSVTALLFASRQAGAVEAVRERFAAIPATGVIAGSPETCVARIRAYVEAGVRHFLFTIPDVASLTTLELVGREVLPRVKEGP